MEFETKIRDYIETKCEDYFLGTVDLSLVENSLTGKYSLLLEEYPRAISIGVTMSPAMPSGSADNNKNNVYSKVQCQLKFIMSYLSSLLEHEGYNALSMPTKKGIMDNHVSFNEIVANLADMGRIEKNHLVTPEVGSRVNWGTVLTNAPLKCMNNKINDD